MHNGQTDVRPKNTMPSLPTVSSRDITSEKKHTSDMTYMKLNICAAGDIYSTMPSIVNVSIRTSFNNQEQMHGTIPLRRLYTFR